MELLYARGLWLLAGLAPLVLFYVLKIKRERLKVSSTWLWAAAQRDLLAKQPWKRLVRELPLFLQILALVALALAFARPASRGGRIAGDHVAIVVDTSASMGALSGSDGAAHKATRMDAAKEAASAIVSSLSPGADAFVIEAGRDARIASPLERDARTLKAAIQSLDVRDVEGDLAGGVALAADRLRSLGGSRRIVIVTDGALARDAPIASPGVTTQVVNVGDAADNAAIVRIDVRSGVDPTTKREQAQVFAMIESFGSKARDAYVTLTLEGRSEPSASRRVLLAPNDKTPVVLTFEPKREDEGQGLIVQIAPGDALAVDDVAYALVPGGRKMPVVLASRASYSWLARALEADPDVSLQRLSLDELTTVNIDPDALVIVEGACPAESAGRDLVIVNPPEGTCFEIDVGKSVDQPQLTSWETGDPRFRFLTLDGVHVSKGRALTAAGVHGSLVRAGKTTLIADASIPGRAVTLLGFDPGESDWPLKASFVLFVRNLVETARLHRAQGASGPLRTGDPLRIAVPAGVTEVLLDGPGMKERAVPAKAGFAVVPPIDRAGFYHVKWLAPHVGRTLLAANLTSAKESDIRQRPLAIEAGEPAQDDATHASSRAPLAHHEWSAWLALFASIVLAFDVWWLTRRPRAASRAPIAPLGMRR